MDDVRPEFKSIREVKDKMQSWKWSQAKSYNDSWASLSLKDLFRPFIRMELAGWLPLQGPNKELDQMEWCAALMDYGFRDSENQSGLQASDPDLNLIPTLIEKVLLPKLTRTVLLFFYCFFIAGSLTKGNKTHRGCSGCTRPFLVQAKQGVGQHSAQH